MIDALQHLDSWMRAHDLMLDLITVWALATGAITLALVKAVSWWTLRHSRDQTRIGESLKRQKRSESIAWVSLACLYGLTLLAYHAGASFGFYDRLALRAVIFVAILGASVYGVRFVYYLRRDADAA